MTDQEKEERKAVLIASDSIMFNFSVKITSERTDLTESEKKEKLNRIHRIGVQLLCDEREKTMYDYTPESDFLCM